MERGGSGIPIAEADQAGRRFAHSEATTPTIRARRSTTAFAPAMPKVMAWRLPTSTSTLRKLSWREN